MKHQVSLVYERFKKCLWGHLFINIQEPAHLWVLRPMLMWGQTTASHLPRQGAGHSTGRLDHLALPDCQPIYTQDNNLHHDCPVAESRGEAALCDAPMVKKKRAGAMTFRLLFPCEAFPEERTNDNVLFCHCILLHPLAKNSSMCESNANKLLNMTWILFFIKQICIDAVTSLPVVWI